MESQNKEMRTMMWNYGMGWGGWLAMSVLMVAFWAAVVFGIVALFRSANRSKAPLNRPVGHGDEAVKALELRFARGEVDEQEYRNRLAVLRANPDSE